MRQPTREEYNQLKRQGFSIVPICKAIDIAVVRDKHLSNNEWVDKYLMANKTVIQSPDKYEGTCSLDYLYKKGVLV